MRQSGLVVSNVGLNRRTNEGVIAFGVNFTFQSGLLLVYMGSGKPGGSSGDPRGLYECTVFHDGKADGS